MNILGEVIKKKLEAVRKRSEKVPLSFLKKKLEETTSLRNFEKALIDKNRKVKIIAEFKRASPSQGDMKLKFSLVDFVREYEENGATALSILTEESYFKGSLKDLKEARENSSLPLLRKDFIIDPYELYEARANGADSVLLIVRITKSKQQLKEFIKISRDLGMEPLVEVFDEKDLKLTLETDAHIVGVNTRDLDTLKINKNRANKLLKKIPEDRVKVLESGIKEKKDIEEFLEEGVECFLIGTSLLKEDSPGKKLQELLGGKNE